MNVELSTLITGGALVAAVAVAWGALRTQVKALERVHETGEAALREALSELRASRDRQGERIGRLEKLIDRDFAVRRATGAISTSPPDDE